MASHRACASLRVSLVECCVQLGLEQKVPSGVKVPRCETADEGNGAEGRQRPWPTSTQTEDECVAALVAGGGLVSDSSRRQPGHLPVDRI